MRFIRFLLVAFVTTALILALVSFAVVYNVRFTEAAVKTRFGKVVEGGERTEPGIGFKWPYPIESVVKYDTRVRFLQERSQTVQTADDRQIVVEAFCTWRVAEPLKFFSRFSNAGDRAAEHYAAAENIIRSNLRSALAETSKFRMSDLFTESPSGTQLPQLESRILERLTSADAQAGRGSLAEEYGVEVTMVGINRIVLPAEATQSVIGRMTAYKDRQAQEIESEGEAVANTIIDMATAEAERMKAFADLRVAEIRARGERDSAQYLAVLNEEPELAVFIEQVNFLRSFVGQHVTIALDTGIPGMSIFRVDRVNNLQPGQFPDFQPPADFFEGTDANAAPSGGGQ